MSTGVIFSATLLIGFLAYNYYPRKRIPAGSFIDHIEISKSQRKMEVYQNGILLKAYRISLGKNPIGAKQFEGDNKTPEGTYLINARNDKSRFYKNLGLSYPTESDIVFATSQNKMPGGDIKIHGLRNGFGYIGKFHLLKDWTAGCIAVTNTEMEELYNVVTHYAVVVIRA